MKPSTRNNALIVQSGGCTPVMNRSLVGAVSEVASHQALREVYGAMNGFAGVLEGQFLHLGKQSRSIWEAIGRTPGAVLGSSRKRPDPNELSQILEVLERNHIHHVYVIGGNDSADTAHRLAAQARQHGQDLRIILIPKTIDNDLPCTDHSPGYGSAARFVALATMGAGRDAEGMSQDAPITVVEVMGRNAGWLTSASALGKREERDAPHVICHPEYSIDEVELLDQIEDAYRRWGFVVAIVSENAKTSKEPLGEGHAAFYTDSFGHEYFEGPARYLAKHVGDMLGVRARFEKPGTIQRSLVSCLSDTDLHEAFLVGKAAVRYALEGHTDRMVTLIREPGEEYHCTTGLTPLEEVAGQEKLLPKKYVDIRNGLPTEAFIDYARPLIGTALPTFARLETGHYDQ